MHQQITILVLLMLALIGLTAVLVLTVSIREEIKHVRSTLGVRLQKEFDTFASGYFKLKVKEALESLQNEEKQ